MAEFIIFLEPTRPQIPDDPTPREAELVCLHFEYLEKLTQQGIVKLAGRCLNEPLGLVILEADSLEKAQKILQEDPAAREGIFTGKVRPFRIALHG